MSVILKKKIILACIFYLFYHFFFWVFKNILNNFYLINILIFPMDCCGAHNSDEDGLGFYKHHLLSSPSVQTYGCPCTSSDSAATAVPAGELYLIQLQHHATFFYGGLNKQVGERKLYLYHYPPQLWKINQGIRTKKNKAFQTV